ncbi:MAG: hypothetical protein FJW39_21075 [Acidobacteria bacterium]|nr:hypothetical protein [Acidobacteriota bacterium]
MPKRVAAVIFCLLVLALVPVLLADTLSARLRGDQIFFQAPGLNLIREPLLARLKTGGTVAYDFHLALWTGNRDAVRRRAFERFVVSYDLWEEKFAVTGLRQPRISVANLKSNEIGVWCLDRIGLRSPDLKPADPLWLKLEVRAVDPKRDAGLLDDPDGVNLARLVDLFSRPRESGDQRWSFESGRLRASDLRP